MGSLWLLWHLKPAGMTFGMVNWPRTPRGPRVEAVFVRAPPGGASGGGRGIFSESSGFRSGFPE